MSAPITDDQIHALRHEATAAGDRRQVEVCRVAEGGVSLPLALAAVREWMSCDDLITVRRMVMSAARAECARVIAEAAADGEERECAGHPAGSYDPMGQTVYCDGTCREEVSR